MKKKYIDKVRISSKISVMHDCIRLYDDVFEENMKTIYKDGNDYESIQES